MVLGYLGTISRSLTISKKTQREKTKTQPKKELKIPLDFSEQEI